MRKQIAIAGAALSAGLAVTGCAASASAAMATTAGGTHSINPATLPRGTAPTRSYLVGSAIHPATGAPVRLPQRWAGWLTLVGSTRGGWLVERDTGNGDGYLYKVTRTSHTLLRSVRQANYDAWYLSNDGTRIIQEVEAPYGCTNIRVLTLGGKSLAHRCAGPVDYLGATSHDVWYQEQNATNGFRRWNLDTNTVTGFGNRAAVLADPAHDKVFLTSVDNGGGRLTSLSHPATPVWKRGFKPAAVSPDGTMVAGLGFPDPTTGNPDIVIYRMSNGAPVQRFHVLGSSMENQTYNAQLWWESPTTVLFSDQGSSADRLVRCHTSGSCDIAAKAAPDDAGFTIDQQTDYHDSSN